MFRHKTQIDFRILAPVALSIGLFVFLRAYISKRKELAKEAQTYAKSKKPAKPYVNVREEGSVYYIDTSGLVGCGLDSCSGCDC